MATTCRLLSALLLITVPLVPRIGGSSAQVRTAVDTIRITPATPNVPSLLELNKDTIAAASITLLDLLTNEYEDISSANIRGLTREQLTTRFDVVGRIDPPENYRPEPRRGAPPFFMDALLKNHFRLAAHEAQEITSFELLVVAPSGIKFRPSPPHSSGAVMITSNHLTSAHITLRELAARLSDELHVRVLDETNLQDTFAIDLDWSPEAGAPAQPSEKLLRRALRTQLGLTLRPSEKQVRIIVIDNIELPASLM